MQWHFEFKDWEEAFAMFYRKHAGETLKGDDGRVLGFRKGNPDICLVISTHPYTSGYWIEEGAEPDAEAGAFVYRTLEEVRELEGRVRTAREQTVNLSLGGVVT
jgi:hypothetical protein